MYETWEDFVAGEKDLDLTGFDYVKETAVIRKVGKQWCIFSESGKRLGCYSSRPAAERRLQQIEYFKHKKGGLELAGWECYCRSCGAYFYSRRRCDQARCPVCGEQDDNIEVTGEF